MLAKIVYSELYSDYAAEVAAAILDSDKENKVELYDEDFYKDRKKAMLIKISCGTKLSPMVAIYNDDKELIKAFYKEDKTNDIEVIKKWLQTLKEN